MKTKTKTKVEAPKPLGAAPLDGKALRKNLTATANKIETDPRKRKALIKQGMVAIAHQEAKQDVRERFGKLIEDIAPLLVKHGIKSFHLVAKLDVSAKAVGVNGWAASQKVGDNPLELVGMLTQSIQELTHRVGTSRF